MSDIDRTPDIIEFAEKYLLANGEPFKLTDWQKHILRTFEANKKLIINVPRSYGRQKILRIAVEWDEEYGSD